MHTVGLGRRRRAGQRTDVGKAHRRLQAQDRAVARQVTQTSRHHAGGRTLRITHLLRERFHRRSDVGHEQVGRVVNLVEVHRLGELNRDRCIRIDVDTRCSGGRLDADELVAPLAVTEHVATGRERNFFDVDGAQGAVFAFGRRVQAEGHAVAIRVATWAQRRNPQLGRRPKLALTRIARRGAR